MQSGRCGCVAMREPFSRQPVPARATRAARVGAHSEEPVVDLYAGVGLFGLSLAAARGAMVTLVEGDAISGRDLEENAKPYADRARVIHTSVEDFLRHDTPTANETFIVDPPRTGMSTTAMRAIVALRPARIIYVSCDVANACPRRARAGRCRLFAG
jgi:tRNA/tmRNA/rRNA uracil-C5-methylase (TrmA/RlmC/RlmD family)